MSMLQLSKKFLWVALLVSGLQGAWGFALLGPIANGGDSWQTAILSYDLAYLDESDLFSPGGPVFLGDIGAPKNIGEGYRRNARTLYYTYNANFLGFFGTAGATAVDGAFAIMNGLTNVDNYSTNLSEFPLNSQHFNYLAQSLFLTDIKSVTLHMLVEQMGLADPERFSWILAERIVGPPPGCPLDVDYLVLQRNFATSLTASDPVTQNQYSSYVNNVLYSYFIAEACTGTPVADTEPFSVDPLAQEFTSVAANDGDLAGLTQFNFGGGLQLGGYYTGLTLDDVAGLRYLLSSNNIVRETAATGSLLQTTNVVAQEQLLTTSDLSALLAAGFTNAPANLQALFPTLLVAGSSNSFQAVCTPNVVAYFTNYIGSPYGSPQISVIVTNGFNCVGQQVYSYSFANVITNGNLAGNPNVINTAGYTLNYSPNSTATVVTTTLGPLIGAPYGSPSVTNTTVQTVTTAGSPSGEYFIIPAGQCGWQIVPTPGFPFATVTYTTNVTASATNNAASATNNFGFVTSQTVITAFTNHTYVVEPINCPLTAGATGLYEGCENVKFVRANFDSLIGQFFQPITNTYTMVVVTNSQAVTQTFQRVVTVPDITLNADNFIGGNTFNGTVSRNINFSVGNVLPGLAGPGVINSPVTFNYNKIGNAFRNGPLEDLDASVTFLSQLTQYTTSAWASFDGSTNLPVLYPSGTSILNLENQILVQISPTTLPNGVNGAAYPATTFTATGGSFQPPFTWSATGLPSGLTLSIGGTLSGTPTQSGTFDIVIILTDSLSRTVQWNYTITIP
jgi:hypothetical protein